MKSKFILAGFLFLLVKPSFGQISYSDSIKYSKQLIRIEQQLLNDIPAGLTTNWEKYLHKDFFIVTEDGTRFEKKAFLETFHPMPRGYSGYINITNPKTVFHENLAVINYVSDEYENVFESRVHTMYSSMDTYIKTDTSWTMISSEVFEIPLLPQSIRVPVSVLAKYTGVYQLADSVTCNITLQNDTLFYQRIGRGKTALLPETENIFFRLSDARGRKLFGTDKKGIMLMRERRNGQDVVWKRIKR